MAERSPSHRRNAATFQRAVRSWIDTFTSPNTRTAYRADVAAYARWCDEQSVDPLRSCDRIADYRASLEAGGARPSSVARRLAAVGSFLRYAARHGHPRAADGLDDLERPSHSSRSTTPELTAPDARALVAAADALHPKAALIVRLLMLDGLKVGEAVRANADDLQGRSPHTLLRLRRRGGTAVLPLHPDTARAARTYLAGRRTGPLLLGGDQPGAERLTRFGIHHVLRQAAKVAGIDTPISANVLRRRYITRAHEDGADLDDLRRRVGHLDERTTRRYLPPD